MINSDISVQVKIKFTFTIYEYIIVYEYILLSKLVIFLKINLKLKKYFKKLYFKGHLWTTTSELYWFKAEEIKEKTEMYPETIIGDVFRTQWNIKVEAFCKNRYLYLTVDYFCKTLQVTCFTGLWICLYKTKQDYNLCKFILKLYFIFTLLLCCETLITS